uniref:PHD-type domain-containing protein n=1 Tax=Fagus sylvatica TaxID=28930 RepID=A0A2N9EKN5_FAGSY
MAAPNPPEAPKYLTHQLPHTITGHQSHQTLIITLPYPSKIIEREGDELGGGEECSKCNMFATPCSSCMHLEQVASLMDTKPDEFSDEACKEKAACGSSISDADLLSPSSSNGCNGRQHTSSEMSNIFSACSSRDSFSENVESKAAVRSMDVSENIEMLVKVNTPTAGGKHGFPKPQIVYPRIYSNHLQKQKELEGLGDNISCIRRSDYTKAIDDDHHGDPHMKNFPCISALIDSSPAVGNSINDQPACHYLASSHFDKADTNYPWRPNRESSQAVVDFSSRSDQSEISSLRDSFAGASSLKEEPSDCSEEQAESSLKKVSTFRVGGQMQDVNIHAESVKADTEMNNENPVVESASCSDQKDHAGNSSWLVEEPHIWKPPLQSQLAGYNDKSITLEDEVRVCDICGDAGREESLVICSKCSDGAEHIYCMSVVLDKVPEGNWLCEECLLEAKTEKGDQDKVQKAARTSKASSMPEIMKISGNASTFRCKGGLKLNLKDSGVKEIRTKKVNSSSLFPAKKSASNMEAVTVTTRALETSVKLPGASRTFRRRLLHGDSSFKNSGHLFKSKSFNIMDSRVKGQLSKDIGVQKKKNSGDTASEDMRKGCSRMMSKSMSFSSNATDAKVKTLAPYFSHVEDLKKLNHAKEWNSTQGKYTSELRPTVSSPVANSGVSASMNGKEIASRGESNSSGSNYHDLDVVEGHEQSNNSLNPFSHLAQQGLKYRQEFDDVSRHSTEATCSIKVNNSKTTFPSNERPYLRNFTSFTIPSQVSAVPQIHCIWQGEFEMQRSEQLPSSCYGMQAHLSTYASPKVLEVVLKLPQKIILEEVPRLSVWPTQFSENHATEDNIALYYFAKDLESYGRNYKRLLESMIKNDMALKGNLDGVELLIFSSNFLPEQSHRWNKLLFLWGVFRGRRVSCSQDIQSSQMRQERDTRRQEMNPKPCFQEREHIVDQEREFKRMKSSSSVVYEHDGYRATKNSTDRFPFGIKGVGPNFSGGNLRWCGVYDMSISSTTEGQVLPTDGEDQSGLNLELALGAENKSKKQGVMPSFLGIMGNKIDKDKHSEPQTNKNNKDGDEAHLSLSLSLAFPFPN